MKPETKKIRELTRNVEGWLHDLEGELLYNLGRSCKGKGIIVEIGSWKGKSTIWLAKGSQNGSKVKIYAIDPHSGSHEHRDILGTVSTFNEFESNINKAQVHDVVIPILKTSEEASKNFNEPVELIFIDGAHEYNFVKLDFEVWYPRVITGGIMVFHDTIGWPGPKQVVKESVFKSKQFRNARFIHSTVYAEKATRNSVIDRIRNHYVFFLLNVYQLLDWRWLPKMVRVMMIRFFSLIH